MFYSVRETWSHVIEMLHGYWLELSRHRSHIRRLTKFCGDYAAGTHSEWN